MRISRQDYMGCSSTASMSLYSPHILSPCSCRPVLLISRCSNYIPGAVAPPHPTQNEQLQTLSRLVRRRLGSIGWSLCFNNGQCSFPLFVLIDGDSLVEDCTRRGRSWMPGFSQVEDAPMSQICTSGSVRAQPKSAAVFRSAPCVCMPAVRCPIAAACTGWPKRLSLYNMYVTKAAHEPSFASRAAAHFWARVGLVQYPQQHFSCIENERFI